MWHPIRFSKRLCLLAMLLLSAAAGGSELSLRINDIASAAFGAHGILLSVPENGSADLSILQLTVHQRMFRNVRLHCGEFMLSSVQMACRNGSLDALPGNRLDFTYVFASGQVHLSLTGRGGESWQVTGRMGERDWQLVAQMHNAQLKRLNPLLPGQLPQQDSIPAARASGSGKSASHPAVASRNNAQEAGSQQQQVMSGSVLFNQGILNGVVRIGGNASGVNQLSLDGWHGGLVFC